MLAADSESKTGLVEAVSAPLKKRWESSPGAQENRSLRGRIWRETAELKWK